MSPAWTSLWGQSDCGQAQMCGAACTALLMPQDSWTLSLRLCKVREGAGMAEETAEQPWAMLEWGSPALIGGDREKWARAGVQGLQGMGPGG